MPHGRGILGPVNLLPLDEVRARLRVTGQSYLGVREIPVERIVGSLDRSADFARDFRPRRSASRRRLAGLRAAFGDGALPPIEVYEAGGAYFVSDGHHRVALARERGIEFLDAHVIGLRTNYELPRDTDVRHLVHTEAQRVLMEESGLARARPDVVIEFALPRGYPELLEVIKAYGWDLARERGAVPPREEVAARWHDEVYAPGVAAVRAAGLPEAFPFKTEADLFLWVYERRRDLRVVDPGADFAAAADYARREGVGLLLRRRLARELVRPLRRRGAP
jgi:hypothetical protein